MPPWTGGSGIYSKGRPNENVPYLLPATHHESILRTTSPRGRSTGTKQQWLLSHKRRPSLYRENSLIVHLADASQYDYSMTGAFDFRPKAGVEPLRDVGLDDQSAFVPSVHSEYSPDHYPGIPPMYQLPAPAPHPLPQCSDAIAPFIGSPSDDSYGYRAQQTPVYRQFMQTPQFTHASQSFVVCPTPTSLPSVPDLIIGTNGVHQPPFHDRSQLPSCDHTNCYPPFDVEFLSRRFPENEHWIRARATAVASVPHRRRGSELS